MTDTLILPLDSTLKNALLALRADNETLEDVTLRLLRQAGKEVVRVPDFQQHILNHPDIKELLRRYKYDPNEVLPCGMTVGEYDSLTEEEEAALWEREMEKELDKADEEPELNASPTAVTVRQRRATALSQRSAKHRPRKKHNH